MRWIILGMVLNEELYCEYSLRSVYDFADSLHIVSGANAYAYWANPYGLSSDRTSEIIKNFPDPEKKLHYYEMGWVPSKRELRNAALRTAEYKEDTCILILDLDEIWDEQSLKNADDRFNNDKELVFIHNDLIQLRGDFRHYRDMSTGEQEHSLYREQAEKQPIVCRDGTVLRQGRTAERLFKWLPGMHYVSHTCICDIHGRYPYIDPAYRDRRECVFENISFMHMGHLKPFESLITKFCYFAQQDAGMKRNDLPLVERALNEGYIQYLRTGIPQPAAWAVSPLPEGVNHIDIMKNHPYYNKTEREIVDPEGKWLPDPDTDRVMELLAEASKYTMPAEINKLV